MAQTFLNLSQGVTGTLPNANFSGGKVLQVVTAYKSDGSTVSTSSSVADVANLTNEITAWFCLMHINDTWILFFIKILHFLIISKFFIDDSNNFFAVLYA